MFFQAFHFSFQSSMRHPGFEEASQGLRKFFCFLNGGSGMRGFFSPHSVAIVGVSETPGNLGRRIVKNLHEFAFEGIIYQVGRRGGTAFGRRIYHSIADIPDQVDLAVILVPARFVPGVLGECGKKGIHRAIIETAGFSEYGPEGQAIERELVSVAKQHGIRFIGPNCIGVTNLHNGLVVPFAGLKDVFSRGKISIISQSGGVGLSYLNVLASESIGLGRFVSVGNKLDVDECDLLEFLIEDDKTDIICIYLEGFSDGRRLMEIARRTSKPILLHKSNVGELAAEIAHSHTASLSGDDNVVSSALDQVGIARLDNANTLVNYLKMLPLPAVKGNRLAILSRSGGHAVIAADVCENEGFSLAHFPEPFLREIEKHFRASVIRLSNPLDLGDLFDFDVYLRIVEETLKLEEVDAVVFWHIYVSGVDSEKSQALFRRIDELSFKYNKPVAICVSTDQEEMSKIRKNLQHPVYTEPDDAIHSLALVRDFDHLARKEPVLPKGELDHQVIQKILDQCRQENRDPLLNESLVILSSAGLAVGDFLLASAVEEAVAAAGCLGAPLAMKLVAQEASHKTDIGGVLLGLEGADAIEEAFLQMQKVAQKARIRGPVQVLLQPMVKDAMEIILGARRDQTFGPVALVGLGGVWVEVLKDVSIRLVPFGDHEADGMIEKLSAYPLLRGVRGQVPRDLAAIRQGLYAVARLIHTFEEIVELDVNPLLVMGEGQGALAVDGRLGLKRNG
jgi:acetyltransferase